MKKNNRFFVVLVLVAMVFLTACGKSNTSESNNHGEGRVQGGIKSDEEIEALQEEERAGTVQEVTEPENNSDDDNDNEQQPSDDTIITTSATGNATDAQSYWRGDDYFDIIGFLKSNGYKGFYTYDMTYTPINDNNIAVPVYECYDNNFTWKILFSNGYISVKYIGGNPNDPVGDPAYDLMLANDEQIITIDDRGSTRSMGTIEALIAVIQNIESDRSNMDPTRGIEY